MRSRAAGRSSSEYALVEMPMSCGWCTGQVWQTGAADAAGRPGRSGRGFARYGARTQTPWRNAIRLAVPTSFSRDCRSRSTSIDSSAKSWTCPAASCASPRPSCCAAAASEGRGEDVTYAAEDHDPYPLDLPLAGDWTLDGFSRPPRRPGPVPRQAAAAGVLSPIPALGVRERRAGPGPAAAGPVRWARRSVASTVRCASPSPRASTSPPGWQWTRRSSSSSTRRPSGTRSSWSASPPPAACACSTSKRSTKGRSSTTRPTRCSTAWSRRPSPARSSRTRRSRDRRATRCDGGGALQLRRADPLLGTTSRRSPRGCSACAVAARSPPPQHQAVALRQRQRRCWTASSAPRPPA